MLHLHNPYPLLSPWVVRVAQRHGVPVVQTVHNYRQVCAPGTYFRDGGLCTDCKGRRIGWPAVRHACYRGSRPQSAIMAATLAVHRGTWRGVDRYIALTDAIAAHLRDFGVPAERISVKPNALADPGPPRPLDPGGGFLYAARLVPEKGVPLLLVGVAAGVRPAPRSRATARCAPRSRRSPPGGPTSSTSARSRARTCSRPIADAAAVIVASRWPDVLPTIAIEALAAGRPVLGTSLGGIPWVVGDAGWIVDPESFAGGLAAAARDLADPAAAAALSARARARYETTFTPEVGTKALVEIYAEVSAAQRRRLRPGAGGGSAARSA